MLTRSRRCKPWLVMLMSLVFLNDAVHSQSLVQCPPGSEISPCACIVKKSGLDIVCEDTDISHISKAMDALKKRQNIVIFYLKLRHNSLPKLPGFVFLGLNVYHLTVHNSSLAVVEETSLSSIGKTLTQLDVSRNSLNSVPSLALKPLQNLMILNINHNNINHIHGRAFEGMDTLEVLNLYGNKISTIDADAFKGLDNRKLKRLNLGGNELTAIPTSSLATLDILKKLEIQENKLTKIGEGDFAGLNNLESLVLSHNSLREVPSRVFSHLTQLNSLELDGNAISHVDPDAFIGLEENLQYLRLGDNNLHMVPSDALKRLHRLRHLDLRSNNITVLPEDAFTGYGDSITFLNLQKNLIKVLPPMVFENLNSLEILNLQNNKLTRITEDITENIVDTLEVLDLTDNPLLCDCELKWFTRWLKKQLRLENEVMVKKKPVCTMPSEHREYHIDVMPLESMGCIGPDDDLMSDATNSIRLTVATLISIVIGMIVL